MAMSYMKELPIPCVLAKKAMEVALISDIKLLNFYPEPASLLEWQFHLMHPVCAPPIILAIPHVPGV